MTTTKETVHGMLRLEDGEVTVQWRRARKILDLGSEAHSTEEEIDPVREARIPIAALAGAIVRRPWWKFWAGPRIVLMASDLQALEAVTGEDGLRLAHPAKLELPVRRADALVAAEFAAELELAVAERTLARSDERRMLAGGGEDDDPEAPSVE